ncbi:hypothetical protein H2248_004901 [Termitomyces sp. 'cryptogamus']|nr:hypothetical protein H2248_004901 [Termitomyces sp. 'cryptogamus']
MAAKFLCCLPLRLGVLVIAFIQFLITGATAAAVWWSLLDANNEPQLTQKLKTGIILIGVVYTVSALVCLTGFIGALARKLGAIRTYLFVLYLTLILQIAVTVFSLISFYNLRHATGPDCLIQSNGSTYDICEEAVKIPQGAVIASAIIPIVIQMYACYIVSAYKNRLLQQKRDKDVVLTVNPVYAPVPGSEHAFPVPHANLPYVYGNGPHAFGNQGGVHHV